VQISIFNDVIGPVMRGNSSSHCAAALRIGRLARDLVEGDLDSVLVEFDRAGSLPTTHESQGSDMGLCGGLLGWDATDERLPDSPRWLREAGVRLEFAIVDAGDPHPNTYRLTLRGPRGESSLVAISTGGGMIEVIRLDGFPVSMAGDRFETLLAADDGEGAGARVVAALEDRLAAHGLGTEVLVHRAAGKVLVEARGACLLEDTFVTALRETAPGLEVRRLAPVLPVLSRPGIHLPFETCEELLRHDAGRGIPLWKWAVAYERERGALTEQDVVVRMVEIVRVLRRSIAQGIEGTHYDDRLLGHQSGLFKRRMEDGGLADAGVVNRAILYTTALMEVKSAMGIIVAAPTAGACAALPGACIAVAEEMGLGEEEMARAMLAAGLVGVFIASQWTFAAEVGGCQAEGGAAAAMAAAAVVTLQGGTLSQAVAAPSLALQGMLGLICDPVAARVEVPCLSKNVLAAANAITCANMALAGFDPVIPFDEVVDAARRVGDQLPRELRCTALGGLATSPTALRLEGALRARVLPAK
jgi:L-serine dehydratase